MIRLIALVLLFAIASPAWADEPRVLVHVMPWYVAKNVATPWGSHWAGPQNQHDPSSLAADGLPDVWSNYNPLIGPYDSADPYVVECQLLQMKLAGIDGVVLDWYGLSDKADYVPIHEATQIYVNACQRLGLSFAICFEDRTVAMQGFETDAEVASHLAETFAWVENNWFNSPAYERVDGRPLLLVFGPIEVVDAAAWDAAVGSLQPRPTLVGLHHLWRDAGFDGGMTWIHPNIWDGNPDAATATGRMASLFASMAADAALFVASACPGFDDVYAEPLPSIAYREGATLSATLDAALASPAAIVQIATWNDYGEGTMIEPTHEFGFLFLKIVQNKLADRLPPGVAADDLRLPMRLLELRRTEGIPADRLDRIASLLRDLQTDDARRLLDEALP